MVEGVGDVDVLQLVPGVAHHPGDVRAGFTGTGEMEGVRGAVKVVHPGHVDRTYEVDRRVVLLAEVVRVGLEVEGDALALEEGKKLLHGPPEGGLALGGLLGAAVELRVHQGAAEVGGDLDHPFPVADGGLPLVLVGRGPLVEGKHAGELYSVRTQ